MPGDATEGVAEHSSRSSRQEPSINLHAPVTAFMFSCSGSIDQSIDLGAQTICLGSTNHHYDTDCMVLSCEKSDKN